MNIAAGSRLGPYEIVAPIGAGGMGEVWRARDPRLGRKVAIKVLPATFSADPDRLRRFEQEARAAGILNHPNITAVYDIGEVDGAPYVVSELLEGETLRASLAGGRLSPRRAIDYALQIARGLAAAHEKGIVHRDLKPENLFVTKDGRVKILDFGLAKLIRPDPPVGEVTSAPTMTAATEAGVVMGTIGYMSPEQVRGEPADHRSDIFSFGTVLYEMVSGERPFRGETAVETMNAILKEEPPGFEGRDAAMPAAIQRITNHCLEKDREARFQSARDLAFDLESMSGISVPAAVLPTTTGRGWRLSPAMAGVALVSVATAAFLAGNWARVFPTWASGASAPSFHQLTFRRGYILTARFAPDGRTIVYDALWDGKPSQLFTGRTGSTESAALSLPEGNFLSISRSDELAVLVRSRIVGAFAANGTLARMPLVGGAPREILEGVQEAEWSQDGETLAVVRRVADRHRIERPPGKVLYTTGGWVSHVRISPDGSRIAFLDHPVYGDDRGSVAVLDSSGRKSTLSAEWTSVQGLAWSSSGKEIWFTASMQGYQRALYATTLQGRRRAILAVPGSLRLHDIFRDGRVLLAHDTLRAGILGFVPGQTKERDLSWEDFSYAVDVSADGSTVLIADEGTGAGSSYGVYIRGIDGSPPVRLGDGLPCALSPDKKWAMALLFTQPQEPVLLPTGAGEARHLRRGAIESYQPYGSWFPDGKRILLHGYEKGHGTRFYVQPIDGEPRAISGDRVVASDSGHDLSPDGRVVFGRDSAGNAYLYPVDGGEPKPLPGLANDENPVGWSADGRAVYLMRTTTLPSLVYKMDLASGTKVLWKDLTPADPAGIMFAAASLVRDGEGYVYSCNRFLSDLYLVEGLR